MNTYSTRGDVSRSPRLFAAESTGGGREERSAKGCMCTRGGVTRSPRLFAAGTAKRSSDTQGPEKSNSNLSFLSPFFVDDFFFSEAFANPL